jgi:hypothetical protein
MAFTDDLGYLSHRTDSTRVGRPWNRGFHGQHGLLQTAQTDVEYTLPRMEGAPGLSPGLKRPGSEADISSQFRN